MLQAAKDVAAWLRDYITAVKHGHLHPFTPVRDRERLPVAPLASRPILVLLSEIELFTDIN